jgi:hypothetical protein
MFNTMNAPIKPTVTAQIVQAAVEGQMPRFKAQFLRELADAYDPPTLRRTPKTKRAGKTRAPADRGESVA